MNLQLILLIASFIMAVSYDSTAKKLPLEENAKKIKDEQKFSDDEKFLIGLLDVFVALTTKSRYGGRTTRPSKLLGLS